MARRSRSRFVRPAPRTMVWIGDRLALTTVAASSSTLLTVLGASVLLLRPFTIVRTRISIYFDSDQESAAEFTQATYSEQVVTESAATAGIASLPTPHTEPDADFFVYQNLFQNLGFITGVGFQENGANMVYTVDSKAMRKVGIDDDVVGVVQVGSGTGARIAIEGRALVKLH